MNILSIDQSLNKSGVVLNIDGDISTTLIQPPAKYRKVDYIRLDYNRQKLLTLMLDYKIDVLLMEDYAYAAQGHAFSLGEWGGTIKMCAYDTGVLLVVIPIGVHKKYTTHNGGAKKDLMMKAVLKRWGFDTDDDNIADAFSILKTFEAYMDYIRFGVGELTQKEIDSMKKLDTFIGGKNPTLKEKLLTAYAE